MRNANVRAPARAPRSLTTDVRGLSTVEYVILLVAVGCMMIAAYRSFGSRSSSRAGEAQGHVAGLGDSPGGSGGGRGGGGGGGGGGAVAAGHRPSLEDGAPEQEAEAEEDSLFARPVVFLGLGAVLLLAVLGKQFAGRKLDGGGGGAGGGGGGAAGAA
ncbi:MAG: hypothetical protein HY909_18635 [Deltaproteobacteria bacterium]|nr:hypothetical protein [Deltaproteobacteria bacterium]